MTQTNVANDATERIRDLNEQVLDFGRKAGGSFLDSYETTFNTLADYQDKLADSTEVEWVASVAHAQAKLTREASKVYATAGRELLK